jgi:hypothetical protein
MRQSTKAALLSGLIFPGVGQISTARKKRGWIFVALTIFNTYLILHEVITKAFEVVETMQKSGVEIDVESISNATSGLSSFSDNIYLNTLLITLIVIWLYSVFDAYFIDKT